MELEVLGIVHRDLKPENILIKFREIGDKLEIEKFAPCDFSVGKISENMH